MRKIYILILLMAPFVFQACLKEQADLFDETPAERMDNALSNYRKVLSSADNGWLLEYYADRKQIYGGYAYIVKFSKTGVVANFELAGVSLVSEETLYNLIADYGPVLSFDTYNSFLHFFSTPTPALPDAYMGDLEFILLGISEDQNEIQLKGKKTGNYMFLRRMTEDAESYLTKLKATESQLDASSYSLTMDGKTVTFKLSDRILSYEYVGDEDAVVTGNIAYCVTDKGIRLYKPLQVGGMSVSEFILQNGVLVSLDGTLTVNSVYPPINEVFAQNSTEYTIRDYPNDVYDLSDTVKGWIDEAYASNVALYGEELRRVYINYTSETRQQSFLFASWSSSDGVTYRSNYFFTVSAVAGTENKIQFGSNFTMDSNATYYPYFGAVVQKILDEKIYILEPNKKGNPTQIRFTSENNPDIWFVITR